MAKQKLTNYQVTIGYKAVITIDVKAEDDKQAKEKALAIVGEHGIYHGSEIQDETYGADGVLNMDATWNMVNG